MSVRDGRVEERVKREKEAGTKIITTAVIMRIQQTISLKIWSRSSTNNGYDEVHSASRTCLHEEVETRPKTECTLYIATS